MESNTKPELAKVSEVSPVDRCFACFELANGESVSPCHRPANHKGDCQGWVLGNKINWRKGVASEYEQYLRDNIYQTRFINRMTSQGVDYELAKNEFFAWGSERYNIGNPEQDADEAMSYWSD